MAGLGAPALIWGLFFTTPPQIGASIPGLVLPASLLHFIEQNPSRLFMRTPSFNLDQITQKLGEVFRQSPARDLEQNLKAGLSGWLSKLDLVTREEFDVQNELLSRTREKLTQLEARLKELEARHQPDKD